MNKLVAIVGPTASGKTDLGVWLCQKFNGEIISADSRQVYRGLDIGTGKEGMANGKWQMVNGKEKNRVLFLKERARWIGGVPQYLVDIIEPGKERYNLARFLRDAQLMLEDIWSRGKLPVLVGGTGLYISALVRGYKLPPQKMKRGDWHKKTSPAFKSLVLGLEVERPKLYQKIDERVERRELGIIREVKELLRKGIDGKWLVSLGLEYKYITLYIEGLGNKKEMVQQLKFSTHAFARRQLTWLRHQLSNIHWIKNEEEALRLVKNFTNP